MHAVVSVWFSVADWDTHGTACLGNFVAWHLSILLLCAQHAHLCDCYATTDGAACM